MFAEADKEVRLKLVCPVMNERKVLPYLAPNLNEQNHASIKPWFFRAKSLMVSLHGENLPLVAGSPPILSYCERA